MLQRVALTLELVAEHPRLPSYELLVKLYTVSIHSLHLQEDCHKFQNV